ncbi:hypothetical protein JYT91_01425 [archaeon AH-315-M20]|nr:hypothetical protein [archaeon AH-315-M20]
MNPIKKAALYLTLIGSLAFGGSALAQSRDSTYQLQESIGADLEIFKIEQAVYRNDGKHTLDLGNSFAQYRGRNTVFVWYTNPETDKNEILTEIKDLNGDGIVDVVKINDWKPSVQGGDLIHRIDNVSGPESVVRGPYLEKMGGHYMPHHLMEDAPKKVVPDKDGIAPYQRVFDLFRKESEAFQKK